jgi:hypothetical protein
MVHKYLRQKETVAPQKWSFSLAYLSRTTQVEATDIVLVRPASVGRLIEFGDFSPSYF